MATFSILEKDRTVYGNKRVVNADLVWGGNYTTGGDAVAPSLFGLTKIDAIQFCDGVTGTGLVPRYDYATGKVLLYRYDGAAAGKAALEEVANAVSVSLATVRVLVHGV